MVRILWPNNVKFRNVNVMFFTGSFDFMYDFPHANEAYGITYPQGAAFEHVHSAMHHCQTQSIPNATPRYASGGDLFHGDFSNRSANNYSPIDNFATNASVAGHRNIGYDFSKFHPQVTGSDTVTGDHFGRAGCVKVETFPQLSHWNTPTPVSTPPTASVPFPICTPQHQIYGNKGTSTRNMMVSQVCA